MNPGALGLGSVRSWSSGGSGSAGIGELGVDPITSSSEAGPRRCLSAGWATRERSRSSPRMHVRGDVLAASGVPAGWATRAVRPCRRHSGAHSPHAGACEREPTSSAHSCGLSTRPAIWTRVPPRRGRAPRRGSLRQSASASEDECAARSGSPSPSSPEPCVTRRSNRSTSTSTCSATSRYPCGVVSIWAGAAGRRNRKTHPGSSPHRAAERDAADDGAPRRTASAAVTARSRGASAIPPSSSVSAPRASTCISPRWPRLPQPSRRPTSGRYTSDGRQYPADTRWSLTDRAAPALGGRW